MASKFVITVDLGGTKVLSALIDSKKNIIDTVKLPTIMEEGRAKLVRTIAESVKKLLENNKVSENDLRAISMGVPGTVNPETGIIGNAPNLGIAKYNIKRAFQKYFQIPILIENDVNLAALGIKQFEFKNKTKNMLVVFVGTGIGGALIFDNKLYRGSNFYAGEIGHMKVNNNGYLNLPKKAATFETIASRTAIVKAIKKELKNYPESVLHDLKKKQIKSKAIANAINKNDKLVKKHVDHACKVIGSVLGSITTLLNLDTIVLGGGVIEAAGDYMVPKIIKAFEKSVLEEPGKYVKILATKLGDDAPLLGGVALADEFIK